MANGTAKPKYSDFGLDETKRSVDKGTIGKAYCCWGDMKDEAIGGYGHNVTTGFSLCFQHFVICKQCVEKSFLPSNKHRWIIDPIHCFKCKNKAVVCYQQVGEGMIGLGICKECMEWAAKTLGVDLSIMKNDRQRQAQQSLFPDNEF